MSTLTSYFTFLVTIVCNRTSSLFLFTVDSLIQHWYRIGLSYDLNLMERYLVTERNWRIYTGWSFVHQRLRKKIVIVQLFW